MRNRSEALKHIMRVVHNICEKYEDRVVASREAVDKTMKQLGLPTSNVYATVLMREALRQMITSDWRRHSKDPEELAKLTQEEVEQLGLFPTIQERYSIERNDDIVSVPRMKLTEFERWEIIRKLRKIGGKYFSHADELQKETEMLFRAS